ncbi:DNA -methyltransferase 1 protein [Marine Group I thaumarchaeote SCGC AAA799-E16]|nr:DNA -methyltransferase 1 protein [Marine Group I thaumarchaeote SCGC AAA799-E16]
MAFASLYDEKVIEKQFAKLDITTKQRKLANEWIKKIKNNDLKKEVENYQDFRDIILIDILGYPKEEIKFEEKDVEFSVKDIKGRTHVVFEAKGTKTKNLFARQNYGKKEQEHPVLQTVSNMQRFAPPAAYGICTNYNDFVLLDRELGITKCHRFTFTDIENNLDKLKEFIGIFSYDNLVKENELEILYEKSVTAEKDFTNEFYKLFHETRLMLIREFQENQKDKVTKNEAIYYTQIFLDRLIFIFFAEDKEYISDKQLFAKRIFGKLQNDQLIDVSKQTYNTIMELFVAFDIGSKELGVPGFNGELFSGTNIPQKIYFLDKKDAGFFADDRQHSKLLKSTKLNDDAQKIINSHPNLNPIISNLLIMESFDFNTEVDVNILGHIFEQSISDLEEYKKYGSRRKDEGVFYTPDYITEFICRNTIIPYLSKSNLKTTPELIQEYGDNIDELESKFSKMKIVDPACGSGAFLSKAVDILLEIYREIFDLKEKLGKFSAGKDNKITKWNEEEHVRMIIENNIYGADINRESVEITKLSLFLKLASDKRKLFSLSKNIIVGNSLISDKVIEPKGFSWEEKFPDVIHKQFSGFEGFDIVIGNPPYVQLSMNKDTNILEKKFLINKFKSSMGRLNTFGFFTKLGMDLLKDHGMLGFIIPNTVLTQDYYEELREMILNSCKIESIVNFSDLPFKDAVVENIIITLRKTPLEQERDDHSITIFGVDKKTNFVKQNRILQKSFLAMRKKSFVITLDEERLHLKEKLEKNSEIFKTFFEVNQGIALKHDRDKYIKKTKDDDTYRRVIDGKDINRYSLTWGGDYLKYDINAIHSCKREDIFISSEKLFFRRVGDRLTAAFDDKKFYSLNTLVVMNKKLGVEIDILYFLGLFNSKLLNYYYKAFLKSTKKVFSEIQARQVENLPVKIPDNVTQEKMISLVKKILLLNKQVRETGNNESDKQGMIEEEIIRTDNEIDELVNKIYGITKDEEQAIESFLAVKT